MRRRRLSPPPSQRTNSITLSLRSEGNEAFKKQDYPTAVAKYTEAVEIDPTNHVYFSNRRCVHFHLTTQLQG